MAKKPGRPRIPESKKKGVKVTFKLTPRAVRKLDKMAKELLRERQFVERRILDLTDTQFRALQLLRKQGRLTNKDYRTKFRVSDKRAYGELMALIQKGLIKRKGKGRTTHYVLAF